MELPDVGKAYHQDIVRDLKEDGWKENDQFPKR